MNDPLITVFTPTYNRAHTLHRVFDSLCDQTLRDFEWVVVDDGSNDGTPQLVANWSKAANFPIRYFSQTNGGKHLAHNRALLEARGFFFAIVDSDDSIVPEALENLAHLWNSIPEGLRSSFCSIGGLCCDQSGKIVGDEFPTSPFDADLRETTYVYGIRGEKWLGWVTDILRQYPFPDVSGTYFPEGLLCFEVAKKFKTRWSNKVMRIYYVDDPTTGTSITKIGRHGHHAFGRWYYFVWLLNNDLGYFFHAPFPFIKAAILLPICAWYSGKTLLEKSARVKKHLSQIIGFLDVATFVPNLPH